MGDGYNANMFAEYSGSEGRVTIFRISFLSSSEDIGSNLRYETLALSPVLHIVTLT